MLKTMHLLAVYLIVMHNGIDKDYTTIFYSFMLLIYFLLKDMIKV